MKKWTSLFMVALLIIVSTTAAFALDDSTACPHCKETVDWVLWDGSTITASGHYYLSGDASLSATMELAGLDVTIDLGGNTLSAPSTNRAFTISDGATLSLVDTSAEKTGTLKGATNCETGAGTIYASGGSVVNLYSGTITGGTTDSYSAEGGTSTSHSGGNLQLSASTFNMYGGTVSDGKSTMGGNISLFSGAVINMYAGTMTGGESSYVNANALNQALRGGGNVYIGSDSVLNMYGGTISEGSARRVGGNVSVWIGTMNMYGGTVCGGTSVTTEGYTTHSRCNGVFVYRGTDYGSFYMYGGKLDTNLCYYGTATDMIVYNGMLKNDPAAVVNSRGSATTANALSDCACYTTDGIYYTVWHTGDNTGLCTCGVNYNEKAETVYSGNHAYVDGVCTICGAAYEAPPEAPGEPNQPGEGKCPVCDKDVTWTAWNGAEKPAEGDHFRLTASATMTAVFEVTEGEDFCIDLNGYTLSAPTGMRAFYVQGSLDIMDSRTSGSVRGSTHANNGGTIYVSSDGTLTLHSGTIAGGTADGKYGGNIYSAGITNLRGGTITGGNGSRGGNIASTGKLNIYDDSVISNGVAGGYGGNIYTNKTLNIYGGTITGGESEDNLGGNIALMYADMVMTGGLISEPVGYNIATNGTASSGNSTIKILGGEITGGALLIQSGNHAVLTSVEIDGGRVDAGVLLKKGTLAMYSGYLKAVNRRGNTALIYGGTMGVGTNCVAPCACQYKNADGTYTIWHPVLTDGVCSACERKYESSANNVHTYLAGDDTGTCVCKYCEATASGFSAVAEGLVYESLTDALEAVKAGTTVTMLKNATAGEITVPSGVILDLNGYTLTADIVTAAFDGARIIDGKQNGTLAVAPENLSIMHTGNKLPVSTESGIQFAEVLYDRELEAIDSNRSKFKFHFTQDPKSLLAKAVTEKGGTDVKIIITITYLNAEGVAKSKSVEIDSTIIAKYTAAWGRKQFVATIVGTENITDLHCTVTVESCGIGVDSDACSVGKEALENKKVIFFGNSFTYYGKCVLDKGQSTYAQSSRDDDKGLFYQICNANGIDVNVTNFTFGGHTLEDHYSGCCNADRSHDGLEHLSYITDWEYDYVILQNGSGSAALNDVYSECEPLIERFRAANPDVKIVFLVHHQVYVANYNWLPSIPKLEENGVMVVDWGSIVYDLMNGNVAVTGAEQTYNKNSFVVAQSASDGYHQNVLSGYITAVAAFCSITGEKAVDQVYDFGDDHFILGDSALASYKAKYYKPDSGNTYDYSTNFIEILNSNADMEGIQKVIDLYLTKK